MDSVGNSNTKDYRILSKITLKPFHWHLIYAGITVILLGWIMWSIHDRFIPIQEGWMQYYSLLTRKGMLPYKDFFYFTQPIPLFIVQFLSKLGDGYMIYRFYGMIERILLILALYYLISKHFSPTATFIAVTTSAFLYQSFSIDIFYTYYQTTLLFFICSLICLERRSGSHYQYLYDFVAGIFASLSFFTKQSNGLFASCVLLFIVIYFSNRIYLLRRLFYFLFGWTIPAITILAWLVKNNIYKQYISQVFGGISSKGSSLGILFSFWVRNSSLYYLLIFIVISLVLYFLYKYKIYKVSVDTNSSIQPPEFSYISLLVFPLFIFLGLQMPPDSYLSKQVDSSGYFYQLFWLYFPFFILTVISLYILTKWIIKKPNSYLQPMVGLIFASFAWTYSAGLSDQLELYANLLGTAFVLGILYDRVHIKWKYYRVSLISLSCLVLFICAVHRNRINYSWWGWTEFGHSENVSSIIPEFSSFNLSYKTVGIYDRIYLDILNNTTLKDFVYTYPFMTIFNYITGRLQPTFSPVHYLDVCPDNIAISDAELLRKNPPKIIVFMRMPQLDYQWHEEVFRKGQPSGQRAIDAAISEIVQKYHYVTIDALISPGWGWPLYVWIRP
jgi:hypothetical protein